MPAAAAVAASTVRVPAVRQLRREPGRGDAGGDSFVARHGAARCRRAASRAAGRPAAFRPSPCARATWLTPTRPSRWPMATRSPSCRRWPEAEHVLPHRAARSISPRCTPASRRRSGAASRAFVGLVRDHHQGRAVLRLDYSAYGPMAEAECGRIVAEAATRWPVGGGAPAPDRRARRSATRRWRSSAASAHRDEAFAACRFVIEEVKRRVPDLEARVLRRWHGRLGRPDRRGAASIA